MPLSVGEETTTIGYKRLLRFKTIQTSQIRISFTDSRGPVCISTVSAYMAPEVKGAAEEKKEELKSLGYTVSTAGDDALVFDLGAEHEIGSFFYLPVQGEASSGLVSNYEISVGTDKSSLKRVAAGEFSNIRNNPIMQEVFFTPVRCRYVQLKATRMVNAGEKIQYKQIIIR